MKKAIFFINSLNPGGAERVLSAYIRRAEAETFVAAVICLRWTADCRLKSSLPEGCKLIELLGRPRSNFIMQALRAIWICWENRDASLHGWMYHGCAFASMIWWLVGRDEKIVWAIHSSGFSGGRYRMARKAQMIGLGAACQLVRPIVVYCGDKAKEVHLRHWRWPSRRAIVIKNGVDVSRFKPSREIYQRVRREINVDSNVFVVGYVGRWHPDKNVGMLCRALSYLGVSDSEVVVVFGGPGLNENNVQLMNCIDKVPGHIRCICLGEIADTSLVIPAFDVLCLCSSREAFPLVLCEALACGVVCVGTDVGDCRSIIDRYGKIVPVNDARQFGRSIGEFVASASDKSTGLLREEARRWAVNALDERRAALRYFSLLKQHGTRFFSVI